MILSFFYLEMSQKSSTFADVIELDRHIEILLLSNDCVIVPDLGGFMAHHIDARYDACDHTFLPPQRTLGFNPQLRLNDSLLAQSYVEAYDISYPEAVRRIESEVTELKQYLETEGYYELNDIGSLSVNDEGKLFFEPCEAGILTPELYGLSSFEMIAANAAAVTAGKVVHDLRKSKIHDHDSDRAITIKMSWVRNAVATAAAFLAFFILSRPVSNSDTDSNVSLSQINLPFVTAATTTVNKDSETTSSTVSNVIVTEEKSEVTPTVEALAAENAAENKSSVAESKPVIAASKPSVAESKPSVYYSIVLASQVSQRGAENFVSQLQQRGLTDVRIYNHHNIRRVICGSYATEAEAYQQLQLIHQYDGLAEAWVYLVKGE